MLKHTLRLFRLTFTAWIDDKATQLGAALAFYSVLSLGPLLLLLVQVGSVLIGRRATESQIMSQLGAFIGSSGLEAVRDILHAASVPHQTSWVAKGMTFAVLLFGASGVFNALQETLNIIWKVPERVGRPWLVYLREKLFAFLMVIVCGFLLFASLAVSTVMNAGLAFAQDLIAVNVSAYLHRLDILISFAVSTVIFALIFKIVPDRRIRWLHIWPGALLTAALFVAGKYLIGLYLAHTGMASAYGAAGSLVVLLVWVYYSAQILFFGAEFTHVVDEHGVQPKMKGEA